MVFTEDPHPERNRPLVINKDAIINFFISVTITVNTSQNVLSQPRIPELFLTDLKAIGTAEGLVST